MCIYTYICIVQIQGQYKNVNKTFNRWLPKAVAPLQKVVVTNLSYKEQVFIVLNNKLIPNTSENIYLPFSMESNLTWSEVEGNHGVSFPLVIRTGIQ